MEDLVETVMIAWHHVSSGSTSTKETHYSSPKKAYSNQDKRSKIQPFAILVACMRIELLRRLVSCQSDRYYLHVCFWELKRAVSKYRRISNLEIQLVVYSLLVHDTYGTVGIVAVLACLLCMSLTHKRIRLWVRGVACDRVIVRQMVVSTVYRELSLGMAAITCWVWKFVTTVLALVLVE